MNCGIYSFVGEIVKSPCENENLTKCLNSIPKNISCNFTSRSNKLISVTEFRSRFFFISEKASKPGTLQKQK